MNNPHDNTAKVYILEERVNNHDARIDKHETRIDRLEETVPLLQRLEAILEMKIEINKAQSVSLENQNKNSEKTFQAINQNLTQLNMTTERLKEDFDKSNQQSESKIEEINKRVETNIEKRKIDTTDWGVKVFYWIVMGISTMLLAWAMTQAGLN